MCWLEACWCYVVGLAVGDVVSECRVVVQPALGYHITNSQSCYITPTRLKSAHYSLHNNTPSSRKHLRMDVLTSETCWAVNWHNKASVIKLVYLYSNTKCLVHKWNLFVSQLKKIHLLKYCCSLYSQHMLTIMWTFKTCVRLEVVKVLCNALHSPNHALWYTHVRKTNKMHTFLNNLFNLIYPRHLSNNCHT